VARQHYDGTDVCLFLRFVLCGKVALRAAARLFGVLADWLGVEQAPPGPDWTTGRLWLMRVGLARLQQPKEQADDWVWLIDHSAQLGRERCLVVLGVRLAELPGEGEALCLPSVLHILRPITAASRGAGSAR
jgi:hypothetical protein